MLKTRLSLVIAALVALGAGGASRASAQGVTTGGVTGIVTNPSGAGIESAQVQVINTATGARVGALSRVNGLYTVLGLEVGGPYTVTVRRIGFQPTQKTGIIVPLGQTVRVDLMMAEQKTTLSTVEVRTSATDAVISRPTPASPPVSRTRRSAACRASIATSPTSWRSRHRYPPLSRTVAFPAVA